MVLQPVQDRHILIAELEAASRPAPGTMLWTPGSSAIRPMVHTLRSPAWARKVSWTRWASSTRACGLSFFDFLCFNVGDPKKRYHAPNTIKLQGNIYLGEGSVLWSVRARKMMTVVEDTCGGHDTIFGYCLFELDDVRYGARNPRVCQQNFEAELARHGLGPAAVDPNINFFMRVPVDADGSVGIDDGWSRPGDHVTLRAEMDVLVVISNCPEALNPATGAAGPKPVRAIRCRP